jgi:hypothetical protein
MPRRGIGGSSSFIMSNFLRNLKTDFQSACTSLQSHQQWRSVPCFLNIYQIPYNNFSVCSFQNYKRPSTHIPNE